MIEEITGLGESNTREQRWSHLLTLLAAIGMLLFGLNLRSSALNATTIYSNPEAGIRVSYPYEWLLEEGNDFVLRVSDLTRIGFKTSIQVRTIPVGTATTERNVRDQLILSRNDNFIGYQAFSTEDFTLSDDSSALRTEFAFVDADINPFAQPVLNPVRGTDIITIRGGTAIVITFLANADTYDEDSIYLDRFLNSLELF